jgi:glycosyltransferase involved in cell wall biosynthesis
MLRILTVTGRYLPGYKAGGPIRAIANLVEWLGDEFEFYILTADRDMSDRRAYPVVVPGEWQSVGKACVRYLTPREMRWWHWRRWLNEVDYDVLYLNSFFSPSTRAILGLRWLGLIPRKPTIVAPRGEFSPGALALKYQKKRPYVWWAQRAQLYAGLIWQATSESERAEIRAGFGAMAKQIEVVPNLPNRESRSPLSFEHRFKRAGTAQVVFLSRIARKKNLDFALQVLRGSTGQIEFNIYGPIEDNAYWSECEALAQELPANVKARYCGEVRPSDVEGIFSRHHLFLFPTRGENFGHVILESLQAGCPVLTSDQTPWRGLNKKLAGWDIALAEPDQYSRALNAVVAMDMTLFEAWAQGARAVGGEFVANPALLEANRRFFLGNVS